MRSRHGLTTSQKIAVILIIAIIIGGSFYFTVRIPPTPTTTPPPTPTTTPTTPAPTTPSPATPTTKTPTTPTPTTPTTPTTTPATTPPATTPTTTPATTTPPTTPPTGITLKIITRHSSTIWIATKQAFLQSEVARKYGIVDLQFLGPDPTLWKDTIERVGDVDVAWGGGPTLFDQLFKFNLLSPITDPETLSEIEKIPDEIGGSATKRLDPEGRIVWVGAAISSFGFIVNPTVLSDLGLPYPEKWEDLASIEFAKYLPIPSVAFASPTTSTSHTRIYQIILQKFGWDQGWALITRLAANGRDYRGSVEALTAVESGEVPVSIGIDFYGYSAELEYGCKYVLPFNESIVNADPIALLATSKNKEAAQGFIKWVISVEGQKIWLDPRINRMPIREEVFDTPEGQKRPDLYQNYVKTMKNIGIPFNDELALKTEWALRYYFEATLSDEHEKLVEAWRKLVQAYLSKAISQEKFSELAYELGAPLSWTQNGKKYKFTLEYAESINERLATDTAFVSEMIKVWRDAARLRYEHIISLLP